MMNQKSNVHLFIQGSALLILSNICIKAINFFLLPLYTKNLTPAMLGVSDSITTLTGILLPILVLGLDSAYSAFYFDKEDGLRDKKVFSTIGFVFFLLGIVPLVICFFSKDIANILFHNSEYYKIVIIALVGITINLWYLPFSLELRLKNKMGRFGIASILASLTMIILNILFVSILKLREISLTLSSFIVSIEYLILYCIFTGDFPKIKYFNKELLKEMFVFSLPLIPSVIMAWVLSLSDRYILLYYFGESVVGLYGIGGRFVTLLNVIINAITTAYTTFAFGSKDEDNAKNNYYYIFNVVSIILIVIAFSVSIFSKEIISIMTDSSYLNSYTVIRDMMYGQVLFAMTTIVSYGIIFNKKSIFSLLSVSTGAVVNLILNLIFIPKFGLKAAAFTTLIGYLVSFVVCYYFSEKLYPCKYGILKIGIICIIGYIISYVTLEMNIIVRIVTWIIYCFGIIFLFHDVIFIIVEFIRKSLFKWAKNEN